MSPKARAHSLPAMWEKRPRPVRRLSLNLEADLCATRGPIARGGFSDVFKLDTPDGTLAVKRLRFNEHEHEVLEAMVAKEAAVLTMMEHPHILPFLGISFMGSAICIVSPWAANGPLSLYLARNPEADRLGLLAQVASALTYLHTYVGDIIIHGDLHVDNVLISDAGTALLSDFGLSRIVPEGNSSSRYFGDSSDCRIGRVVYEAPELHDGAPRSWATDVFAFGMLIFHAFSGKPPFGRHPNYLTAVVKLYSGRRPDRREIERRDFSDDLWRLVQDCWCHDPQQRPRMPVVALTMKRLLDLRVCSSPSSGPYPVYTLSQNSPATDAGALTSEPTYNTAGPYSVHVQGTVLMARHSESSSLVSSPVITSILAAHLRQEADLSSLSTATRHKIGGRLRREDILSILECGTFRHVPLATDPPVTFYNAFGAKTLSLDDTPSRHKLPGPGKLKIICLGVLATCTVTYVAYALCAEGTGRPWHVAASCDAEISHAGAVDRNGIVLAPRVPEPGGHLLPTAPDMFVFLSHASGIVIMWIKRTLKNHGPCTVAWPLAATRK